MKQRKELKVLRVTFREIKWKLPFFKTHKPVRKWMEYSDFVKAKTKKTATSKKINNICVVNTPARVMQCTPCTPVSLLPGSRTGCPEWGKGGAEYCHFLSTVWLKKKTETTVSFILMARKEGKMDEKEKKRRWQPTSLLNRGFKSCSQDLASVLAMQALLLEFKKWLQSSHSVFRVWRRCTLSMGEKSCANKSCVHIS